MDTLVQLLAIHNSKGSGTFAAALMWKKRKTSEGFGRHKDHQRNVNSRTMLRERRTGPAVKEHELAAKLNIAHTPMYESIEYRVNPLCASFGTGI